MGASGASIIRSPLYRTMIRHLIRSAMPMLVVFVIDNLVFNPLGLYSVWSWFDIFMHIVGGLVAAWSVARFLQTQTSITIKPIWVYWLLLLGATALIGIAWEVYELYLQKITGIITQPSIADTVADLVNDTIGAALFCGLFSRNYYQAIKTGKVRKN